MFVQYQMEFVNISKPRIYDLTYAPVHVININVALESSW